MKSSRMPLNPLLQNGRMGQVAIFSQTPSSVRQSTNENLVSKRVRIRHKLISSAGRESMCPPFGPLTLLTRPAFFRGMINCSRYLTGMLRFFEISDTLMGPSP